MYWTIKTGVVVALLVMLSASHYLIYTKGQDNAQALCNKEKLIKAEAEIKANEQYLKKIKQLQIENEKVNKEYDQQKRKAADAASGAQLELDRLHSELTSSTPSNTDTVAPTTPPRTYGGAGLEQELLGHCAATLVGMAAEADRLETIIVGLQKYVTNVLLAK